MRRPEDIAEAARQGVDAVGLIFVAGSRRAVEVAQAAALLRDLPPLLATVGVLMDPTPEWVAAVLAQVPLQFLQFHGDESPEFCVQWGVPYLKALPMGDPGRAALMAAEHAQTAVGLLLDSHGGNHTPGQGQRFDWAAIPDLPLPWLLAGGLDADNVRAAVRVCRDRWGFIGVDVASGIESTPGHKDSARLARFVAEAEAGWREVR